MIESISPFSKSQTIVGGKLGSCDLYVMKPGGVENKHFHNGIEIVLVLKGNCQTHKQGHGYMYRKGQIHEVINDSKNELIFICLTIPAESQKNTHYISSI